ncbi:MAG: hypothetical protein SFT91_01570, partial [Rickettsiaceae bacterium]|nr:hypothetical protein [Rickettsiaceae bacterium]
MSFLVFKNQSVYGYAIFLTSIATSYFMHVAVRAYKFSSSKSPYQIAVNKLGFDGMTLHNSDTKVTTVTSSEQAESLLSIFFMNGFLDQSGIVEDFRVLFGEERAKSLYNSLAPYIKLSEEEQGLLHKIDIKKLSKNFLKDQDITDQEVSKWIIYASQKSFARHPNKERYEIKAQEWMRQYSKDYMSEANKLGLIEKIEPLEGHYDMIWVLGASRIGVLARVLYINDLLARKVIDVPKNMQFILTGPRLLWAEIDGIDAKIGKVLNEKGYNPVFHKDNDVKEDGRLYLQYLAKEFGIELDKENPFITYNTKSECPPGLEPNRIYPNYAESEEGKLHEAIMCINILETIEKISKNDASKRIIDAGENKAGSRPDTASTAAFGAQFLIDKIADQALPMNAKLLVVTNNPYIPRQTIQVQSALNKALQDAKINGRIAKNVSLEVEGIGF